MEDWTKKQKEGFLTALATTIKKDPITSIRKYANELEVHEKTNPNISSFKTLTEEQLNKMSKEFILKACKSFWKLKKKKKNAGNIK